MSEKQDLIREMLEMQRKFIDYERGHGLDPKDYYTPEAGHPLETYRKQYRDLSMKVLELAHRKVGSKR
jgi:hypothetical protein